MIRVLLADDHALIRRALRAVLEDEGDFEVVAEVATNRDLVPLVLSTSPDVLTLDISMPDQPTTAVIEQLMRIPRAPRILVLTVHPEEVYALQLLRAGAVGYVSKAAEPDEIVRAIRAVSVGRRFINDRVAELLATALARGSLAPRLSQRERQVLMLIGRGMTPKKVAGELGINVKTVHTYRASLMRKLGLDDSAQLSSYAARFASAG